MAEPGLELRSHTLQLLSLYHLLPCVAEKRNESWRAGENREGKRWDPELVLKKSAAAIGMILEKSEC